MDFKTALTATPCNSQYGHDVTTIPSGKGYMIMMGVEHFRSKCWNCGNVVEWTKKAEGK